MQGKLRDLKDGCEIQDWERVAQNLQRDMKDFENALIKLNQVWGWGSRTHSAPRGPPSSLLYYWPDRCVLSSPPPLQCPRAHLVIPLHPSAAPVHCQCSKAGLVTETLPSPSFPRWVSSSWAGPAPAWRLSGGSCWP